MNRYDVMALMNAVFAVIFFIDGDKAAGCGWGLAALWCLRYSNDLGGKR